MASRREIAEAESFRRRLVFAAFLRGGRADYTPMPRHLTMAVALGVIVGLLSLVGAAARGAFAGSPTPGELSDGTVIVDGDRGALSVVYGGVLYAVPNYTSLLLMGLGDNPRRALGHGDVATTPARPGGGVVDAPSTPPALDDADVVWLACGNQAGTTSVYPAARNTVDGLADRAPAALVEASDSGTVYLVSGATKFPITSRARTALRYDQAEVLTVPEAWLGLFDTGEYLQTTSLSDVRVPTDDSGLPTSPDANLYQQLLVDRGESADESDDRYFVLDDEQLRPVPNKTARLLIRGQSAASVNPKLVAHGWVTSHTIDKDNPFPQDSQNWPSEPPRVFDSANQARPAAQPSSGTGPHPCLADDGTVTVAPTAAPPLGAALVTEEGTGSIDEETPAYLVAAGRAHPITSTGALGRLGYPTEVKATLPETWIDLLAVGQAPALHELPVPWEATPSAGPSTPAGSPSDSGENGPAPRGRPSAS